MLNMHINDFSDWQIPDYDYNPEHHHAHKIIVGLDVEYGSNSTVKMKMGGHPVNVQQRSWDDIISIQLAFNYENNHPRTVFIHRDRGDDYFTFYKNVMKPLKQYLIDIGMLKVLKKELKNGNKTNHPFTVELWGFWLGVDITAFTDYLQILTEDNQANKPSNLITIHGNTVFTGRPLKLLPRDNQRHRVDMLPEMRLAIRDMTKLAPAKSNLARLGDMIKFPKLDTEKWDVEAGHSKGYFKAHMTELWKKWPDRFEKYAMTDTIITVKYGSFILNYMKELKDQGLANFKPVRLKASLSAISAAVVQTFNKRPAHWIVDFIINQLVNMYNNGKSMVSDFDSYLHPIFRPQHKDENFNLDLNLLYQCLAVPSVKSLGKKGYNIASCWLDDHLDFDKIRKGYQFPHDDDTNDKHHRRYANDMTRKKCLHKYTFFNQANDAFYGGYNLLPITGVILNGVKQDYDLKSAYNTGGHLIPDTAPALGYMKKYQDINAANFKEIVKWADQLNGPYTLGEGSFMIEYPDDYDGYVITPQRVEDGPRYFRTVKSVSLTYTDAYTAWLCGAKVHTNLLIFPVQAKMNVETMEGVSPSGYVQDIFQQHRNRYPKDSALNQMFKQSGNICYGISAAGLKKHKSTDFNVDKSYYVPFSLSTDPIRASAYTAICRYHIILLQQAIKAVDPTAAFLNNVTDGSLVQSHQPLSPNDITKAMNKLATPWYRDVVKYHFNGVYFEEKDGTNDAVANLKTRFTFSRDAALHALVGLKIKEFSPGKIFSHYLDKQKTVIVSNKHMISSINDMKNNTKFKNLQTSWEQPTNIYLGYDFSGWPTNYHINADYCYWNTRYYANVDEFSHLWKIGRELMKYGPMYTATYAPYFQTMFDQLCSSDDMTVPFLGEYINDTNRDKPRMANEVYYNYAYYLAQHHIAGNSDNYQHIVNFINDAGWTFIYGKNNRIPSLESWKKFIKNHTQDDVVVNVVLLHRLNLI